MSVPPSPEHEQIQACEQRIVRTGGDIAELLGLDLSDYPERELQRRFMADPTGADRIADADLKRLRIEVRELGGELKSAVADALADPRLWLSPADGEDELPHGKDLLEVTAVRAALGFIDERVEGLARRYRLADDRDPAGYAPPRRFVQRKYLPTLVETYLRDLATLRNLREADAAQREAENRKSLSARWAAAEPDAE